MDDLHLDPDTFLWLLKRQGPSLALWRAAEIAALREVPVQPPVLDLGCGDGLVMSRVLPRVEIGVDPDAAALARARDTGIYRRLEQSVVQEAPVAPASIGTVVSNSVLEHVADIDAALRAVSRLLRPGGHLIFTAPTESFSSSLLLPAARYAEVVNRRYAHLNLWPVAKWQTRLRAAGLELEFSRAYLRPSLVRAWDALDLVQQVRVGRQRLFSLLWRRLSPGSLEQMAALGSRLDLSAVSGGGRLLVARKA